MADSSTRLSKQLGLFDVFVICVGAMFGSGFFLLPGIAAAQTGPSVVLAYLLSGLLIVPALVSKAELATAMPRAGGTYYFLDRTMGPLVGTIGGIGTWLTLMLKSAFALIGMGAYLALFVDLPIKPIALGFTVLFAALNVGGARQSSRLVRALVFALLTLLAVFLVHGLWAVASGDPGAIHRTQFRPFVTHGVDGLVETVGLVFISYIGLTKVASLSEEVTDPERNIPLGMTLALVTVSGIYVAGVYVMVAFLGTAELSGSLTPAADAAARFFSWLPPRVGVLMIVTGAVAAFASMSNSGIMASSRYPLAMSRDGLAPERFSAVGRRGAPTAAILLTCAIIALFLIVLDVAAVAKLASSLQLLIFALVNVAVIVMRESRIESYDPGFRSPLYPWMQLVGIFFPIFLVAEMGWLPVLFSFGVIALSVGWYNYYARGRLGRTGAIFHVFERLGRRRFAGLDYELRGIMKEKGLRRDDPFDEVVARAFVVDLSGTTELRTLVRNAADRLEQRLPVTSAQLTAGFLRVLQAGEVPVSRGAVLLHTRLPGFDGSEMVLVRCRGEVRVGGDASELERRAVETPIQAVFFLASGELDPGRHLRILAGLAGHIERDAFLAEWLSSADEQELKETLIRDERFLSLHVAERSPTATLVGRSLRDLHMPEGTLVALIRRGTDTLIPSGQTVLQEGDRLTVIGEPATLAELSRRYRSG